MLSNGEHTIKSDGDVEVEEPQASHRKGKGQKERNWKEGDIELFIALYEDRAFCGTTYEDYINGRQKGSGLLSNQSTDVRQILYFKERLQKQIKQSEIII